MAQPKRHASLDLCNTEAKVLKYKKLVKIDLCPTRFIKYEDLSDFGIEYFLVNDGEVIKDIFIDGTLPQRKQIFFNSLTPKGKVVSKVILHNILPKMSSMHYLTMDHLKLLYVIFDGCQFNWARFIFDQLIKEHTSCIPYGALITRIFEFYKVVLTNELDETYCKEYIDKATLKRMKLVDSEIGTPFASSSKRPQTSPVKSYALEREILE